MELKPQTETEKNMKIKISVPCLFALLLALSVRVEAQQPAKIPRLGLLTPGSSGPNPRREVFQQALRELGYIEGKNIIIEYRFSEGREDPIPELATELVGLKVNAIVAFSHVIALAVKKATTEIPIIFAGLSSDPIGVGLVPSLARPGGNITGVSLQGLELIGKRVELLKETVPKLDRLAYLRHTIEPYSPTYWKEVQSTSRALGIREVLSLEVKVTDDYEKAFAAMTRQYPDAILVEPNSLNFSHRKRIADFEVDHRLPTMYGLTYFMDAGGLMSYGANLVDHFHRAAVLVDKVLKGAKPADLPVEQPTKFEFVINLKTAKQIGLTIPQAVLFRADRVIK
jgi:putative ABC transport system substrate-binding protein